MFWNLKLINPPNKLNIICLMVLWGTVPMNRLYLWKYFFFHKILPVNFICKTLGRLLINMPNHITYAVHRTRTRGPWYTCSSDSQSLTSYCVKCGFILTDWFLWGFLVDRVTLTGIFSVHSVFSSKLLFHQNHIYSSVARDLDSGLNRSAALHPYNLLQLRDHSENTRIIASMVSSQKTL